MRINKRQFKKRPQIDMDAFLKKVKKQEDQLMEDTRKKQEAEKRKDDMTRNDGKSKMQWGHGYGEGVKLKMGSQEL